MFYIVFALFLFIASVTVHIFFCRNNSKSGLHAKMFIFTAVIFLCIYTAGAYAAGQGSFLDHGSMWGIPLKITAGLIFALLVPIYLSFYVLTQLMSPSKKILLSLSRRGDLSYEDILLCVEEEDFIGTRLSDLCTSGCVRQAQGRYALSPSGQKLAAVLDIMQRILGRGVGG